MKYVRSFVNWWKQTYNKQRKTGKAIFLGLSFLVFCCLCSVPISLLSPSTPSTNDAIPTLDESAIKTAAVDTLVANANQTMTASAPTDTSEPIFTDTPIFTPTITNTPQPPLLAEASCIPQDTLRETAIVLGIVDGDTINVELDGQILPVRYIGVDAPETGKEYYGQAAQLNQDLVYSKTVSLITDVSDKDNNGILLRYVIVDNVFVNSEIVKQGFALAVSNPPDIACSSVFANAESQAKVEAIGIWIPTPAPNVSTGGGGNCDPSYPGVCIPPPPPDLNCSDIPHKNFTVLSPDPHNFDGNGDGVGCES